MKKLKLNKTVISNLTREEAGKILGGGITDGCQTHVYEGCSPGATWEDCSYACTDACSPSYGPCVTGLGATCSNCQSDYGCPQDTLPYTACGTIC